MQFKECKLENGLTIIGEENPQAASAAIGFFTRTGSRDETDQINGVSHFLEHMMFKGTDKLSFLQVNEEFDRTGAKFNAFTSEENTVYYAAVLPEFLHDVTSLWTQLMRPALRDEDFNMEKNVIKEEIAMYEDTPHFDVIDKCRTLHFGEHPCGKSVLGTAQSIDGLTAEQMRSYFHHRYAPNNIVVAISGNFDFDKMTEDIRSQCKDWEPAEADRELSFFEGTAKEQRITKESLVREHICLMSPAVAMQDQDRYATLLLARIIGDDIGSRYFWELIDTAIADSAQMGFDSMDAVGVLYSYFQTSPENAEKTIGIVKNIFADLLANGITEEELQKAKNKVLSAVTIKNEVPMGRLIDLGFNWQYLGQYRSIEQDVQDITSVTIGQINDIIKKYEPGKFTQFRIGP